MTPIKNIFMVVYFYGLRFAGKKKRKSDVTNSPTSHEIDPYFYLEKLIYFKLSQKYLF